MREHRVIAICLGAAALIATAWLFARAEPVGSSARGQRAATPRPTSLNQSETSPTTQLVQKIRRQIGSPLDGSVFEGGASEVEVIPTESCAAPPVEFDEVYEEIAGTSDFQGNASWHCAAPPSCDLPNEGYAADSQVHVQQSLRDAARQLESTAADLEDSGAYNQADGLRRWARRLRNDARQPQ